MNELDTLNGLLDEIDDIELLVFFYDSVSELIR